MFNKEEWINKYVEQDSRLDTKKVKTELIANNKGWNFERITSVGRGVWELHPNTFNGTTISFRVLSMEEEAYCEHQSVIDMKKNYPMFEPGSPLYHTHLQRLTFIKLISLSTSPSVVATDMSERHLTEDDIKCLSGVEFAELVRIYKQIEATYNPTLDDVSEETISTLVRELQDPEKKYLCVTGMTSNQLKATLLLLLEMIEGQEDNIQLSKLLEESKSTEIELHQTANPQNI
jgi:hypothetical protein